MAATSRQKKNAPLTVASRTARSVRLERDGLLVELSALDRSVFRVRATSRRTFSKSPSWAVVDDVWNNGDIASRAFKQSVRLESDTSSLAFDLRRGIFELFSDCGEAFRATAMGFEKKSPFVELALDPDERLFGLGETSGTFNKRGLIRTFWNTDVLGHAPAIHPGMRSLYVSIPFAISIRDGVAAGLFWDNPARQTWDLGSTVFDSWKLQADSGELDLYLILGPDAADVVERFTKLTGRMSLPPQWALGYHQCRYSYESRKEVETVARMMRRKRIPCDALYFDIHHMDGYRVFTFGKSYPKPRELVRRLAKDGFKVVTIVDPGVKDDPSFGVLKRGRKLDVFVKESNGRKDFSGRVWPGRSRYPDFLNAATRDWWAKEQSVLSKAGVAGFWNDMNEPANFARPDKTLHPRALHRTDHGMKRHAEVHNLYGMQMARASQAGALRSKPRERPFIITRAGYAGVQRHSMVWTGDNSSTWHHFEDSIQQLLNLGVSGVPFCGSDAGGFLENCTPELFVRWMQCAAFTPFFRNHTNTGTIAQEPWSFGEEAEGIVRKYVELRYRLMPYLQSLFLEASRTGMPVMRPLYWHYQNDLTAVDIGDQFLLGRELLVAPILKQGATARSVYLPEGAWYSLWSGERIDGGRHVLAHAPLEFMPLFVRGGATLPFRDLQRFAGEKFMETVSLHHWIGGAGSLTWREDDDGWPADRDGAWLERDLLGASSDDSGKLILGGKRGSFPSAVKTWRLIVHGMTRGSEFARNGRPVRPRRDTSSGLPAFEWRDSPRRTEFHWQAK